jgi:hypothetical protein
LVRHNITVRKLRLALIALAAAIGVLDGRVGEARRWRRENQPAIETDVAITTCMYGGASGSSTTVPPLPPHRQ